MPEAWVHWLGAQFSPEAYLFWTRIQCLAWTTADVVLILGLLALFNRCRREAGYRTHFFSYLVLGATVILAPLVWWAPTGALVFALELCIPVPHFLMILYLLAASGPLALEVAMKLTQPLESPQRHGHP